MKVFHCTVKTNGESIINEGTINLTDKKNSIYGIGEGDFETTEGLIYLAITLDEAFKFGLMALGHCIIEDRGEGNEIYVFEIILAKGTEIFRDNDQMSIKSINISDSLEDDISKTGSFCVKKKLKLGTEVRRYSKVKIKNTSEGYTLIDKGLLEKIIQWKKFI